MIKAWAFEIYWHNFQLSNLLETTLKEGKKLIPMGIQCTIRTTPGKIKRQKKSSYPGPSWESESGHKKTYQLKSELEGEGAFGYVSFRIQAHLEGFPRLDDLIGWFGVMDFLGGSPVEVKALPS